MKEEYKGLTTEQAQKNQLRYGFNELSKSKGMSPLMLFFRQFGDVLTLTLIGAMVLSVFLGEYSDAVTVLIIVLVNGILGFVQEYKTEKSIEALNELSAPMSLVIRDGKEIKIPSREVTVGDIILLESGDRVSADCRLIESVGLTTDESSLTGESVAIEKDVCGDNALFMGTTVMSGRGRARVEVIGMGTKMGSIAYMLKNTAAGETPLKKYLNKIGKELVLICAGVCILIFIAGMFHGQSAYDMFLSAVSLAVAAIPEGLPAAVTVSLTIGVARMVKRNALIRKLPAVETLGCTNVVCSDKTGTLTQNKMTVKKVYCDGRTYSSEEVSAENNPPAALLNLLICANQCNNVSVREGELCGDPTEIAIYSLSQKSAVSSMYDKYTRISEIPFDSVRKSMTVICTDDKGNKIAFVKGGTDKIINMCNRKLTSFGIKEFSDKNAVRKANEKMADDALRVLAFAYKPVTTGESVEDNLIFLGLEAMMDPPRKEAYSAIKKCYGAGIRPVMITGDHKNTARAIADELGFKGDNVPLTGEDMCNLTEDELADAVHKKNVFARVSPEDKLRIVKAFKRGKNIVAMTGDGVNDAPSLREADIGIAMGGCGTDVAKEASDMILLDDNFSTIISAVEEGRVIYGNIRKFIRYLLSCNLGEILLMGAAAFCGIPMPLVPIQILWLNLVTDGLPALALGADRPEDDIMSDPPRKEGESIFSKGLGGNIVLSGVLIGAESLLAFSVGRYLYGSMEIARTIAFATMIFSELLFSFECRSESRSIFKTDIFNNMLLIGAVFLSAFLTFLVIYVPSLSDIFKTVPLNLAQWGLVSGFGIIEFIIGTLFVRKSDNK